MPLAPPERHRSPRGRRWYSLGLLAVLALAGAVRFAGLGHSGFIHWDEDFFVRQARDLAANWSDGLHRLGWFGGPLTSLLTGLVMKVAGTSDHVAIGVSAAWGTLTCVVTAQLGRACLGARAGVAAGLLMAVSPFAFVYSRLALAESLFLLLFVCVLLAAWTVERRQRLGVAVAGGLATGALTMTKFNGIYGMALVTAWVVLGGAFEWLGAPRPRSDARKLVGSRALVLVAWGMSFGAVLAWLLPLILPRNGGLARMLEHFGDYTGGATSPSMVAAYLATGTAIPVLVVAGLGVLTALVRRCAGDLFLLLAFGSFLLAVTRYIPYPRLGLPLLPLLLLFAAAGVDAGARLAPSRVRSMLFWSVIGVLVSAQLHQLGPVWQLRTRGYAQVAALVAGEDVAIEVWSRTQPCLQLYTDRPRSLDCDPQTAAALSRDAERLLIFDQVATWSTFAGDLLARNRDRIVGESTWPNPMYAELLLQPFTWDRWRHYEDPPAAYRQFRLVRTRGPLAVDPACLHPSP